MGHDPALRTRARRPLGELRTRRSVNGYRSAAFLPRPREVATIQSMPKRIPVDCKRITEAHLRGLDEGELGLIAQRIEIQTQALNRAMRLVAESMARRRDE